MATFSRQFLSGLSGGQSMGVTSSGNTTIHTVPSSVIDEIWLYCVNNNSSTTYTLTVNWPGGNEIKTQIPASQGLSLIIPGLVLSAGQTVTATSDSATAWLVVTGFANRIT